VAVQIDLKNTGAVLEEFWDGADFGIAPQGKGDTARRRARLCNRTSFRAANREGAVVR